MSNTTDKKDSTLKPEQEKIINHNERNIIVSASAGSGKTFVMIERLCRLILEKKAKVDEILAVTFTESAARDMKEKLKKALTDKIKDSEGGVDEELAQEIKKLDQADVSTLHSFAAKLIRTYYSATNVLPDFAIIEDAKAQETKAECVDKVFNGLYKKNEPWFNNLVRIFSSGRNDKEVKELVIKFYEFCTVEENPSEFKKTFSNLYSEENVKKANEYYADSLKYKLEKLAKETKEIIAEFGKLKDEKYRKKGVEIAGFVLEKLEKAIRLKDSYEIRRVLSEKDKRTFRGFPDETEPIRERLNDNVKKAISEKIIEKINNNFSDEETDKSRLAVAKEMTDNLLLLEEKFENEYAKSKAKENVLDFSDLEHKCLEVLSDENVLDEVRKKYKYIFVDEYQDVNGVQEAIIGKLSSDNVFMVGDVKQSIYGFRGCRPEFFEKKIKKMKANKEQTAELNYTFRSAHNVVEMVNRIFSYSMTKDVSGVDYKGKAQLKEGGVYPAGAEGRAKLHYLKLPDVEKTREESRIYDVLEESKKVVDETDELSALVANIINEELNNTYFDVKSKQFLPVTEKDIAILTRSKDSDFAERLVSGLNRRGVSVISEVKENVCDFPEVACLINALKLIDAPSNDIPLAITMLSPAFNFTEQELADIVAECRGSSFYDSAKKYAEKKADALAEKINAFFSFIDGIRLYADFNGAHEVLKKIIADTGYENAVISDGDGEFKISRINRFLEVSAGEPLTVCEFLKKIELCPDAFNYLRNGGENSVRVMTMHASKGLEFPVTILCGLERGMNTKDESSEVIYDRELGVALKYYDFDSKQAFGTPVRAYIKARLAKNRIKEELRLFYVAATRAKYSLHIVFSGTEDKRGGDFSEAIRLLDYVPETIDVTEHDAESLGFINKGEKESKNLIGKPDEAVKERLKKNFDFSYGHKADVELPLKTGVTAATETEEEIKVYTIADETVKGESGGAEAGTVAHKILENIDLIKTELFDEQIKTLKERKIITDEELSKIDLKRIKTAIINGGLNKISGKVFKEQDFIALMPAKEVFGIDTEENVLVQGRLDLLVIEEKNGEKTAQIYDYKYSKLSGESLKKEYKKQLSLYALAVERVLGVKVTAKTIVNILSGESVNT